MTDAPSESETDALLQKIASTDVVDSDWDKLRDAIKQKIEKNIALFLTTTQKPNTPAPYLQINTPTGGLKLPPFLPRKIHNDIPVSYMNEKEANDMKENIFAQLDQFEENPPFTIQRLCELCLAPKQHYKSVGKYLRAVDKTILVTSTHDTFPPLTAAQILNSSGRSAIMLGPTSQSAPATPLFSPIPFLHEDARRSKSRSPPPTPLALNATPLPLHSDLQEEGQAMKALGLVDEMDDPSPGHMSDHPTALSSVTTTIGPAAALGVTIGDTARPRGSLEQRFVKAEDAMDTSGSKNETDDSMEMDEDKENTKS